MRFLDCVALIVIAASLMVDDSVGRGRKSNRPHKRLMYRNQKHKQSDLLYKPIHLTVSTFKANIELKQTETENPTEHPSTDPYSTIERPSTTESGLTKEDVSTIENSFTEMVEAMTTEPFEADPTTFKETTAQLSSVTPTYETFTADYRLKSPTENPISTATIQDSTLQEMIYATASSNDTDETPQVQTPEPFTEPPEVNIAHLNFELDNLSHNLQKVSQDWYSNVRYHCANSWKTIKDILEENHKALMDWQFTLFDIINHIYSDYYDDYGDAGGEMCDNYQVTDPTQTLASSTNIVPLELEVKCGHPIGDKALYRTKTVPEKKPDINTKCVSAINLAEALRIYWKEAIISCLRKYLREIREEENSAKFFGRKIDRMMTTSMNNFTGNCKCLDNKCRAKCLTKARNRLNSLQQELERHYLNHEVQNLQIMMGIEMCRQVGEIYDETMDQQIKTIEKCQYDPI